VVEFQPHISISDPVLRTEANLGHYIRILQLDTAAPADIIVFPESTLNNKETASYVPEVDEDLVPCTAAGDRFEATIRQISCMARNLRKYVVINLTEKSDCPDAQQIMFNDTSSCPSSGINFYNTNAVFDRRGAVISKYRKYNLFGEAGITQPRYSVSTSFETDFGVTFGHFVCFDLLFAYPALDLVRKGVTDIIFPSMWFSELPFLTGMIVLDL
jgi:pantetheine hydrolase